MNRCATILAVSVFAATARAGLDVSLAPSIRNAAKGTELVFTGSLTNNSATGKLFLNDISAALSGAAAAQLTLGSPAFYSNVPGILLPGETYTGVLFRIALSSTAPAGDYAGSIVLKGGSGIMADDTLNSSTFTVLSPEVSIVATDADAGEFGPDTGTVTVSRTGGTDISLPVNWAIGGNAVNGTAYQAVPGGLTIPTGASSATVTITPIPNNTAEGDRSVFLTLAASGIYNTAAPAAATVTIHDKPADAWRLLHFGPAANDPAAADAADWDFDGLTNLLEYSLALDPASPSSVSPPAPPAGSLVLTYVPNPAAPDVNYFVESSTDLTAWSSSHVVSIAPPPGSPPGALSFRAAPPPGGDVRVFLRLRVER